MGRLVVLLSSALLCGATMACSHLQDCEDACFEMRSCDVLHGTSRDTCDVLCKTNETAHEDAVDACASCMAQNCDSTCLADCVCALSLDTSDYPGVYCSP